jgi:hypothetical protein
VTRLGFRRRRPAASVAAVDHAAVRREIREGSEIHEGRHRPEQRVVLRQLVIASSEDDVQLPAWVDILDRIGTPYDVLLADAEAITRRRLVADEVGQYNAVFLTSGALLRRTAGGRFVSSVDPVAWSLLWEYERVFGIRQVALNCAPGVEPEDYGLRPIAEGAVESPLTLSLTQDGAEVFHHLRPDARLPLSDAYLYRTRIATGSTTRPLLTLDGDVVAALSTAADGRERALICFTMGPTQRMEELLGYGLVHWATRGLHLGEHRHWLNVDIDDWCDLDGSAEAEWPSHLPAAGASARAMARAQSTLRARYPLAAGLTLNLAYNGGGAAAWRQPPSASTIGPDPDEPSISLADAFRWVNHTFSHPSMEGTSYEQSYREIVDNLDAAWSRGLPVDSRVLKTPGYSGLGASRGTEPGSTLLDEGLESSNRELLAAAHDVGVRYLHGNMSFPSHRPECFNGATRHPVQPDIAVVPDWPTAFPWWAGTPKEVVSGYVPPFLEDANSASSYEGIIGIEAEEALRHVVRGSAYTHTLHRANSHEYAPGRSITTDWLEALLATYSSWFAVPLLTPDWTALAGYVVARTAHARAVDSAAHAVWDRRDGTVRYVAPHATSLFVTGVTGGSPARPGVSHRVEVERYGTDDVLRVDLPAGAEVILQVGPAE